MIKQKQMNLTTGEFKPEKLSKIIKNIKDLGSL